LAVEFDLGFPGRFGFGITCMIGSRWLLTLNGFYLIDPSPGSIYAIPVILKAGLLDLYKAQSEEEKSRIDFGLALAGGIRFFILGSGSAATGGFYMTGDAEAVLYWNLHALQFSVDAWPGAQYTPSD
jgi:hypothetical protein